MRKNVIDIVKKKDKVVMVTCYDYAFARAMDDCPVDILLVGDSLANVVLGMDDTRKVSVAQMISHTRAVALGSTRPLVVADMPYLAYQKDPSKALVNAKRFLDAGAAAVKIEWFKDALPVVKRLIKAGIRLWAWADAQTAHLGQV